MKDRCLRFLFLSVILVLVMQCAKKKYPAVITTEDGVPVCTNPLFPREGRIQYEFEEVWAVRPAPDSTGSEYLHDVKVDGERVFVSDWKTGIHVFNLDGLHLNTLSGFPDSGFQSPMYFGIGGDHTVWVLESPPSRVSGWTGDGEPVASFRLPGQTYTRMQMSPSGDMTVSREFFTENGLEMFLLRFNSRGEEVQNHGRFRTAQPVLIEHEGRRIMLGASPYTPTTVWRVSGKDLLYAGYGDTYQIRIYDSGGRLESKFGRQYEPVENPYRGDIGQPEWLPAFSKIWLFDGDDLWIEVYTDSSERDFVYDVFTPKGIYRRQVMTPERIFAFQGGHVFSIVKTGAGGMVKKYRMKEKTGRSSGGK